MDLAFLDDRLVTGVSINIFLVFLFHVYILLLFVVFFFFGGGGSMLVNLTRCMRYWDDLSVTQLLVRCMGVNCKFEDCAKRIRV